ncbi:MAG: formylglycine-generating enzyme family protein [Micrococcaceae bacterium]|nr:formylglycine-generating enzyme family protein [Micrococcaceae bacterium]
MSSCCSPDRDDKPTVPHDAKTDESASVLEALASLATGELQLVGLNGGTFLMGSQAPDAYVEDSEGPVRETTVAPFAIAATTVTNAEFAAFVVNTGHVTDAELHGDSLVFAGLLSDQLRATTPAVQAAPWWRQTPGATWLYPAGDDVSVLAKPDHPVTHVSQRDAMAYAQWAGVRLLTEAEWEFAARGGLQQQPFPWGSVREPDGVARMNTFPGEFPDRPGAPVGTVSASAFEPNAYGLHNMTGNVWEWTSSWFTGDQHAAALRGGSYMCHSSYCRRYRTSARSSATPDTSLGHTGLRIGLSR